MTGISNTATEIATEPAGIAVQGRKPAPGLRRWEIALMKAPAESGREPVSGRTPVQRGRSFDVVDLLQNVVRLDLLGVGGQHRIDELLHLVAVLNVDALQLAGLLQRFELRGVLVDSICRP